MTEPTQYASFEDLVAGSLEDDAEDLMLPSGLKVRIRGLSRHDLMFNGKGLNDGDNEVLEQRNVKSCLVEPKLTIHQIAEWQRRSKAGGDFKVLSEKIRDLSGLTSDADKSVVREDGSGSE